MVQGFGILDFRGYQLGCWVFRGLEFGDSGIRSFRGYGFEGCHDYPETAVLIVSGSRLASKGLGSSCGRWILILPIMTHLSN